MMASVMPTVWIVAGYLIFVTVSLDLFLIFGNYIFKILGCRTNANEKSKTVQTEKSHHWV